MRRRRFRIITVVIALASLLFAQLATAAYACPTQAAGQAEMSMQMPDMHDMPGCPEADRQSSALCHAHCQDAAKSFEKAQMPSLAIVQIASMIFLAEAPPPLSHTPQVFPPQFERATDPPLAIRNCCFRT